jgi:hypothetical protein
LILIGSTLLAQSGQPPEGLYDAGDFYLLRDRSVVPLLRSAREIAVKRAKALPQQELLRATSAERVLTSLDAYGSPTTHQIEQFTVKDPTKARETLAALEGVVWVSPVLATADTGKRVLLSDEIIVQFDEDMATDETIEKILEDLADRGIEVARAPWPVSPGQYLLRSLHPDAEITLAEAAALFQQSAVAWAEPNFLAELETYSTIPNDPLFAWQQSLRNTGTNGAWYCRIVPVKIQPDSGAWPIPTPVDAVAQSIRYAAQFADVISCSWGILQPSSAVESSIDSAAVSGRMNHGCPVFFASGNEASYWYVKPRRVPCMYSATLSGIKITAQ